MTDIRIFDFERLAAPTLAHFSAVGTSVAANLCEGTEALDFEIRRICGEGISTGCALTAYAPSGDNLAVHVALGEARPGDIIVVATDGGDQCAVIGDRIAAMAANSAARGLVTDGLVRDICGLRGIGLPVHARGLSPRSPRRMGPAHVGCPVVIGNVTVRSGDLVILDDDGVAIIPRRVAAAAVAALEGAARDEAAVQAEIARGARYPSWLDRLRRDAHSGLLPGGAGEK